ncbi:unnamed protein product [Clavelina lepadiformis]|uniref:Deoxyhypusine hydroxylase n=1 Tax=Clavelina lepadiformis TaxID=159417 RepID=A0ABP0G0I9_CLALP
MGLDVNKIGGVLNNTSAALSERFRALFMLRSVGSDAAVKQIEKCLVDKSDLLNHELAYCLGQMQNTTALPKLIGVLEDSSLAPILRHEAAEAIGAIGEASCLSVLEKYCNDACQEVAETCQLAVGRIKWLRDKENSSEEAKLIPSPFKSVDPTPSGLGSITDVNILEDKLTNSENTMFERYRAMFSLRNLNTDEAAVALTKGLYSSDSALFRHEVAYVLGQMQLAVAVPDLMKTLSDRNENCMVRHKCAEALGSIANETCLATLNEHLNDPSDVVRESCEVALDMYKYENSDEFNYALGAV